MGNNTDKWAGDPACNYFMGVDLGQVQDYTAISVIEHQWGRWEIHGGILDVRRFEQPQMEYRVRHLERVPLGTSYPDIITIVEKRFASLPKPDSRTICSLLVDATGVGGPVVQMMRQRGLIPVAITITAGHEPSGSGVGISVPKRDLVGAVQVLMQNGQLKVAEGLREGPTLTKELQGFKYKLSKAGNDTYEAWRESVHDDLVLAVALPAWRAYQYSRSGRGA